MPPCAAIGAVERVQHVVAQDARRGRDFADGAAVHRGRIPVEQRRQHVEHGRDAARRVQIDDRQPAGRRELGDQRRLSAQEVEGVGRDVDTGPADLVGDGRKVQRGVGGPAERQRDAHRVLQAGLGEHLTGMHALTDQLDDAPAAGAAQLGPVGSERRQRRAAGKRQPERLDDAVHRVGGAHERARARPAARLALDLVELLLGDAPRLVAAHRLFDVAQDDLPIGAGRWVGGVARQHGAAGDEDRGQVQPRRGHQHARHDLVARAEHHDAVEAVGVHHQLDRRGDHVAQRQDRVHPFALGDAVARRHGVELRGRTTRLAHPLLHPRGELSQVEMARIDLAPRVDDPDQRFLEVVVAEPHRAVQRARICARHPFKHAASSHEVPLFNLTGNSWCVTLSAAKPLGSMRVVTRSSACHVERV